MKTQAPRAGKRREEALADATKDILHATGLTAGPGVADHVDQPTEVWLVARAALVAGPAHRHGAALCRKELLLTLWDDARANISRYDRSFPRP